MRKSPLHPYWLLFLAPLIWSTSNVIGKTSVGLLSPLQLTFYRWLLAFLLLSFFGRQHIKADWQTLCARKWWIAIWGSLAFCGFNLLIYYAFNFGTSVVNVSLINALIPLIIVILGTLFFKQRLKILQGIGILIALAGVYLQLTHGDFTSLRNFSLQRGDALIMMATFIYALYSLALLKAPDVHWLSLMWGMSAAAMLIALPFWSYESLTQQHLLLSTTPAALIRALLIIFYVAIFIAIISKMCYMEGVIALGPNRSALVWNLLPIFNVLAALLFFHDERQAFAWYTLLALILVLSGIFLSEYSAKKRA